MPEYIEREAIETEVKRFLMPNVDDNGTVSVEDAERYFLNLLAKQPTADVVEVVRCRDCMYATEFDKHCELNGTECRHCSLWHGEETKYVWHKYKKYYKDYSVVIPDDYCSNGIRRNNNDR